MIKELQPVEDIIRGECAREPVDIKLVCAIIMQESRGRTWSYRYEPNCTYSYMPQSHAKKLLISFDTEIAFQKTSWGLMQILGVKARELGFDNHLPQLMLPSLAIHWGVKALISFDKYKDLDKTIAAYNAGSPRYNKDTGLFINQEYVNGVKAWMQKV